MKHILTESGMDDHIQPVTIWSFQPALKHNIEIMLAFKQEVPDFQINNNNNN